ncbi:hypothetical protein CGH54_23800 [Vibrio parahaemolyticus]|nr:hypothetical protein CGI14_10330 [Vibrio parahaemolyticus]TON58019.1 hypothetical protein CGH54_23800 [Vibrio parahaemolyticus]
MSTIKNIPHKQPVNKAFKSDSQRLAVSLRSSIAKRRSHLNAALCARNVEIKCLVQIRACQQIIYISSCLYLVWC